MPKEDLKVVFAKRLREARLRVGLSQSALGREAGLEPSVASPRVNQYEAAKHLPHGATMAKLAEALGVPVSFLLTEDDALAKLIIRWVEMTPEQRKELLKQAECVDGKDGR